MTDLERAAMTELLHEIAERLKWAAADLEMVLAAGFGREVVERSRDDFEVIASQHRQLLLLLAQPKTGGNGDGRPSAAEASPEA